MDTPKTPFSLFSVVGIEIEYMIVNKRSLNILAMADQLLQKIGMEQNEHHDGGVLNEVACGETAISNELALHVIELKTNGPTETFRDLDQHFHHQLRHINQLLVSFEACLMPTGAHPFLDPSQGIKLWPHGSRAIYDSFNRIFNCAGHGWVNLQSMHINLPFSGDEEFLKLHNAIRLLLPLIPALTASTPFIEGKFTGALDARLRFYGKNQEKIPSIAGLVIPEFMPSQAAYESQILQAMYRDISHLDTEKVLQEEWLNSRGAIARFDRSAIEIRVVDSQESPLADIACAAFISAALRYVIEETEDYLKNPLSTETLRGIYDACVVDGLNTLIKVPSFSKQLGLPDQISARDFWSFLLKKVEKNLEKPYQKVQEHILEKGNLAERLVQKLGKTPNLSALKETYLDLALCLEENTLFV